MAKQKLAVLISGRGSNLQALIDASADEDFPAEIALVIANRANALGLDRAKAAGIPTKVIDHRDFGSKQANYDDGRAAFDEALTAALMEANAAYVCLAGFMRLLTRDFVTHWRGRLVNIHPSLLPAFKGLNVHERMIDAGVKIAGCTVHFVTLETDAGPIIGQAAVPVAPGDTAKTLADRILREEHRLYPLCIQLLCEGRARLTAGDIVRFDGDFAGTGALLNPALSQTSR